MKKKYKPLTVEERLTIIEAKLDELLKRDAGIHQHFHTYPPTPPARINDFGTTPGLPGQPYIC